MRARVVVPVLALAFGVAGCSTVGEYYDRMLGRDTPPVKVAELPAITATVPARVVWSVELGSGANLGFSPALTGEAVNAASAGAAVVSLDLASGRQRWRTDVGSALSAGVGASNRVVVVGTPRGEVVALDAENGKPRWRAQLSGEVLGTLAVDGDIVVARTGDGRVHGLGVEDGRRRWVYQRALPALIMRGPVGLTTFRGALFAGFPGGKLAAVALGTGVLGWEATVSLPRGATELERVADVIGAPAVDSRAVCAAAYQGRVACFDPARGQQLWGRDLSSIVPVGLDSRFVYAVDVSDAVHAFDRGTGASMWKQDKLSGRRLTGPQPVGDLVAVGDLEGYVHLINRDDGSFAARVATDGSAIVGTPVVTGAGLLVQTRKGGVFLIGVR